MRQHRWQGLSTEHCRCGQHDMLTRCGQRRLSVGVGPFVDRGAAATLVILRVLQRIRAVFSLHSKMSTKSGARKADPVSSDGDAPSQAKVQRVDAAQGPADGVEETIESMVGSMKNKSNIELTADGKLKLGLLIKAACAAVATGSDLKEAGVSGGLTVGHICLTVSPSHRLTVSPLR